MTSLGLREIAFDLVQRYINGWKQNDLQMILSSLAENCIIIESHGPTYEGISDVESWFKFWLAANSIVTQWDMLSFYFVEEINTAYIEWNFSCDSRGSQYSFPGISIIKFSNEKIWFIHEYRMTHQPYEWDGDSLRSE